MPFYQFHIGDYKSHTHHLSPMEDLAFRRLLDHYYLHEAPIKQRDIARQIGMREFEQEVLTVLDEFFVSTEAGYINPRADKEIAKFRNHQAESSYGSFVRDNKELKTYVDKEIYISKYLDGTIKEYIDTLTTRYAPMMGTSSTLDATNNQEPITNNHKPITNNSKATTGVACPDSVDQQVWNDWMTVRREKKAKTLTETGWKQFVKQVDKAGWTIEQAISHCCLKQWVGFEASWVTEKVSHAERLSNTMSNLTNGLTAPKKQFWQLEDKKNG